MSITTSTEVIAICDNPGCKTVVAYNVDRVQKGQQEAPPAMKLFVNIILATGEQLAACSKKCAVELLGFSVGEEPEDQKVIPFPSCRKPLEEGISPINGPEGAA